ncbi:MAG TPA: helix-turn-helix domain-containing protein [Mycobacteriales bacterium]|nr:helix-turn-helix domain-containing protein [Mycobacteriales bacterium]
MAVKRSYSSARRDAQARETRRAILDAARALFVSGYAATTIQAIAEGAGVAVQTVYGVFGSKRELLRQLIEATITGGDDSVPVTEQAEAQAIAAEPDARRRAALDAAFSRAIIERVGPIVRVAEEAAASDPELAAMMETVKAERRKEMVVAARILAGPDGGLRVSQQEAAATLYVLYSPQVADMLMGDYGWSPQRYEKWLARMLLHSVITVDPDAS